MWEGLGLVLGVLCFIAAVSFLLLYFSAEKRARQLIAEWRAERQEHHSARLEIIDLKLRLQTAVRMNEAKKLRDGQAGPRVSGQTPQG